MLDPSHEPCLRCDLSQLHSPHALTCSHTRARALQAWTEQIPAFSGDETGALRVEADSVRLRFTVTPANATSTLDGKRIPPPPRSPLSFPVESPY